MSNTRRKRRTAPAWLIIGVAVLLKWTGCAAYQSAASEYSPAEQHPAVTPQPSPSDDLIASQRDDLATEDQGQASEALRSTKVEKPAAREKPLRPPPRKP